MKIISKAKEVLLRTCAIFTAITFLMCLLGTLLSGGKLATTLPALLGFFAFSFLLAILGEILRLKKLHLGLRIVLHFVGTIASFYGIFVSIGSFSKKTSGVLVMLILFSLLYAIIAVTVLLIKRAKQGSKRDNAKYEAQFNFED